jgi:hypothetical protein
MRSVALSAYFTQASPAVPPISRDTYVSEALSRLCERDQAVLDAYYGGEPAFDRLADVACLTRTAWTRNRSRAARNMHEPIEATVRWLAAATAPDARAAFKEMHDEATAMLVVARQTYASVRGACRP